MTAFAWDIDSVGEFRLKVKAMDRRFRVAVLNAHPEFLPKPIAKPSSRGQRDFVFLSTRQISAEHILLEVAHRHGVTLSEITGQQRSKEIVAARHEAFWRMKKETLLSLPEIGRLVGGRHHSTVMHAVRAHEQRMGLAN